MAAKLSILTPGVWSRKDQCERLAKKIQKQIDAVGATDVEHIVLIDNKTRSIGAKRQALLDCARGDYIAFVDDDDDIADTYVADIIAAMSHDTDVICFWQEATYNGAKSIVKFGARNQDGQFNPGGETLRAPWHVCAWKRELVQDCQFGESNYGEDIVWCLQARRLLRSEATVQKVLHYYNHNAATSEAPPPPALTPANG